MSEPRPDQEIQLDWHYDDPKVAMSGIATIDMACSLTRHLLGKLFPHIDWRAITTGELAELILVELDMINEYTS